MCGRVIDYQVESPDGFYQMHVVHGLNRGYMDGVSITYGDSCHHYYISGVMLLVCMRIAQITHLVVVQCHA